MSSGVSTKLLLVIYIYYIYYILLVIYIYILIIPSIFQLDVYYMQACETPERYLYYLYNILYAHHILCMYKVHTHILHMWSLTQTASHKAGIIISVYRWENLELPRDKELDSVKVTLKLSFTPRPVLSHGPDYPSHHCIWNLKLFITPKWQTLAISWSFSL